MKTSTRVLDRLVVALIGIVLLGGGLWALGTRIGERYTTDATRRVSVEKITRLPDEPWWPTVTAIAGVLLILGALWLLIRHLHRPASRTLVTEGGGTVELGRVADAVTADLAESPLLQRARSSTVVDRGRPIIRVSAKVAPGVSADELAVLASAAGREVTAATNSEVGFQLLVNPERADNRLGDLPRGEERTTTERT
ncbi:hypothetical protein GCM10027289_15980 [Tsukamurella serpentis]